VPLREQLGGAALRASLLALTSDRTDPKNTFSTWKGGLVRKNDNYADIPSPPPLNPLLPQNKSNWTDFSGVARGEGASWPCISKTYFHLYTLI